MPCSDENKIIYNIRELPEVFNIEPVDLLVIDTLAGTSVITWDNIVFDIEQTSFEVDFNKHTTDILELSARVFDNHSPRIDNLENLLGITNQSLSSVNDLLGTTVSDLSSQVGNEIDKLNSFVGNLPNVAGYIAFNGGTGETILSRNLTVQKNGTGQYTIFIDQSVARADGNYCVVLGNVDRGVSSQGLGYNNRLNVYNTYVGTREENNFTLFAIKHYEGGGASLPVDDATHVTRFGITGADPTYVTLAVYT